MRKRRLILMRHATAAAAIGGSDHGRTLAPIGRDEAEGVGRRLRALGAVPARALSSSAQRCRETFEAVGVGLGGAPSVEYSDDLYNAPPDALLHVLAGDVEPDDSAKAPDTLLLIAHNPGISMLAFELGAARATDQAQLRVGFAPATFAIFEIEDESGVPSRRNARLLRMEAPFS